MADIEKRTLTFTYDWLLDHKNNVALATSLMNYGGSINTNDPWAVERALRDNLNCTVKGSEGYDYTKIIFESEEQLTEFLLRYG